MNIYIDKEMSNKKKVLILCCFAILMLCTGCDTKDNKEPVKGEMVVEYLGPTEKPGFTVRAINDKVFGNETLHLEMTYGWSIGKAEVGDLVWIQYTIIYPEGSDEPQMGANSGRIFHPVE